MSPQQLEPGTVLATIAARIRVLTQRRRPVAIAIDGPSGSGKTSLADALAAELAGSNPTGEVRVLHMDDIYPGWDGLDQAPALLLDWVLKPLRQHAPAPTDTDTDTDTGAGPIRWRRYDWIAGRYAEWHCWPVPTVLIVEGVGSGAAVAADHLDLLVWVSAPQPVRYQRGIERDGDAYAPHWRRWQRQEDVMFARDRTPDRADFQVDGTTPW